jgi:CRISPR-associated endoribonuclease Cas6
MPSRWIVPLVGRVGPVPVTAPMAVMAGWLDDARPTGLVSSERGEVGRVPHDAPTRPWSLSPLGSWDDGPALEVRLLDDDIADRLVNHCRPGAQVRLGRYHLEVLAAPECTEHVTWEVLAKPSSERAWQVRMLSPATFRNRGRSTPWPAPEAVARGLLARWSALNPGTVPVAHARDLAGVWVGDLDGHSDAMRLHDRVVSGFVGEIRYVCDGSRAEAEAFGCLLALARFAGVGSHTTFGLGTIEMTPAKQPSARTRA